MSVIPDLTSLGSPPDCSNTVGLRSWLTSFYTIVVSAFTEISDRLDQVETANNTGFVVGDYKWSTVDQDPTVWTLCDGGERDRLAFLRLFNEIGTDFGVGNGTTTFNVPDARGRTLIGLDNMGGISANVVTDVNADLIYGTGGEETHVLTDDELPDSTRNLLFEPDGLDVGMYAGGEGIGTEYLQTAPFASVDITNRHLQIQLGDDEPHNNMQPWLAAKLYIKI